MPTEGVKEELGVKKMKNKFTRNVLSPFINQQRNWEDEEHFKIPPEIIAGITKEA